MPTQGSTVGYQNVTKLEGENGENGKEEYTYTTANDFPDELDTVRPYSPSCSFDCRRGRLLKSTTYKMYPGNSSRVKTSTNQYINAKTNTTYGLSAEADVSGIQGNDCSFILGRYARRLFCRLISNDWRISIFTVGYYKDL